MPSLLETQFVVKSWIFSPVYFVILTKWIGWVSGGGGGWGEGGGVGCEASVSGRGEGGLYGLWSIPYSLLEILKR
jgi:hypothetical protein